MKITQLSKVVKNLRKEHGLTQEDLAMKSGVGLCFIRNLEQGKASLRMDMGANIAFVMMNHT